MAYIIGIEDYLYNYCLHDTTIDRIRFHGNHLIFDFNKGAYALNHEGKETSLTNPCFLQIEIADFNSNKLYEHITVTKTHKTKTKEMDVNKLATEIKKHTFVIDLNYYSSFGNIILLQGYCKKNQYTVRISEINKIAFLFEKSSPTIEQ